MATTTVSDSKVTFSNSGAAANLSQTGTEDGTLAFTFDVLAASGGGKNTTIYSVDDGAVDTVYSGTLSNNFKTYDTDLLFKDASVDSWQLGGDVSDRGAHVWIGTDGKIHYDAKNIADQFQQLAAGETTTDTIKYTIKMSNGTLSVGTLNVVITGTNDAAVITGSSTAALTETNSDADISTSGTLTISDVDSAESFQAQTDTVGSYGKFSIDSAGHWTYVAGSAHNEFQDGVTYTDTFTVKSADNTETSVTIKILGTNDAAVLSSASVNRTETNSDADISTSGTLTISDVDSAESFQAQTDTVGSYGKFSIDSAGHWTYVAGSAHNEFQDGVTYTDTFTVKSADNTETSVTIKILGTNDAAVLSSASVNRTETNSDADISTSGTLTISDVDSAESFQAQTDTVGSYGKFSIDSAGHWTYVAGSAHNEFQDGVTYTDTFTVKSADNTETSVTIKILGTNDAAVLSSASVNRTETNSDADISTSGTLTISDVDSAESFQAQTDTVGSYGKFSIDSAGHWTYVAGSAHNEFQDGVTYTDTFTVKSADNTETSVTIKILGTNDAAVLSSASVNRTETNSDADISTSGTLTISDVDSAESFQAQTDTVGSYGKFSIDSAGHWTYVAGSAHNEFQDGVTYTDTFTVKSADNTETSVTIKILGTNDAAVLSSASVNRTETNSDADISTSGTLTISDVDSAESFQAQTDTVGSYGKFSIDSAGHWTYVAGSAHNEFQDGVTYTDTFTVKSADNTETSVTIKILGTNDAAVLSSASVNRTETNSDADISTSGTLTISDVDSAESFQAQTDTVGSYGKFSIDSAGHWTYVAGSAHNEFQDGVTYTDTFTVKSADNTETSVTIKILGTNDAAVLSSASVNRTETNSDADISTSGTLTISDVDSAESFQAQTDTVGSYGKFSIDSAGHWTYVAGSAHNEFQDGVTYTDTFTVKSADNTETSVTIKILGTNDAAVLSSASVNRTETNSDADISTSGTLTISDVDSAESFQAQTDTVGSYGKFSIDSAGHWTYVAGSAHNEFQDGVTYTDTFTVKSADNTETSVTIKILGTNDAAVLSSASVNRTETNSDADISTSGTLTISDVDSAESFQAQTDTVGSYGKFSIDSAGHWTYVAGSAHNEFQDGVTYTDTFTVKSADNTETSVTIKILGTNDAAVLSSASVNRTETNSDADISTSGTLTISDVDSAESFQAQTDTVGSYGKFSIDSAGHWTYVAGSAHNEFQDGVTYTDTFTVKSADNTETSVTIKILGTNDAALITGSSTAELTETNAAQSIGGHLNATDVDSAATFVVQSNVAGDHGYGKFSIDAAGTWTYTMDSAHDEFVWGTDYTDSTTVKTDDGTSQVITVTMHGTNDVVVASLPTTYGGTGDTNDFDSSGLPGTQTINDGSANITRYGGAGNDTINGEMGGDVLYGGSGDDTLTGGQGTDAIYGGSGTDTITGNNSPDNIYGGFGADIIDLNGDGAADTIYYIDLKDTGDTINNFVSGEDKINLSAIDSGDVDHAFNWGGQQTGQYVQAHSVTWFQSGSDVVVLADTDGNLTTAEFSMTLSGISSLNQNDFLL